MISWDIDFKAIVTVIGSAAAGGFWQYRARMARAAAERESRIAGMESEITQLKILQSVTASQVAPLWSVVQSKLAAELTHPHARFKQPDALLKKLEAMTITPAERIELVELLDERIATNDPEVDEEEKDSARIFRIIMKKVTEETQQMNDPDQTNPGMIIVPK